MKLFRYLLLCAAALSFGAPAPASPLSGAAAGSSCSISASDIPVASTAPGASFAAESPFAPAPDNLVRVVTRDVTLAMLREPDGRLSFAYFGPAFAGDAALAARRYIGRPDAHEDMRPEAYLAYGGRNYLEPALKVTHADGSQTTELVVGDVTVSDLGPGRTQTTVHMRDKVYPLAVDLIFTAYRDENVITQQVRVTNEHRKNRPVTLENVYSAYLPLLAPEFYLTHFHGTWAREM